MAVTSTARLGITDWSVGTDPFTRAQLSADHERLDAVVAIYGQGTLASRPAPGTEGRFYWATNGGASTTLTYDTGAAWVSHPHAIGDLPVAASGTSNSTQLVRADDARLSNARPPTAHSHAIGDLPVAASGTSSTTQLVRADDARLSDARTPTAHTHDVSDVTSGTFSLARLPVAASGTASSTQLVRADDARLSNARTPNAHASTHSNGGTDEITVDASQVVSGVFGYTRGGTGRGSAWSTGAVVFAASTTVLSQTAVGTSGQLLQSAGAAAPVWVTPGSAWSRNVPSSGDAAAGDVVLGADSRLSDARPPTSHSHAIGDLPVATSGTSNSTQLVRADDARLSNARPPTAHSHAIGDLPVASSGTSNSTQLVRADDSRLSNARTPLAHTHAAGDVTSGTLAIARLPVAASGASNTTQVVRADDARLSNARPPTAHTHSVTDLTATGRVGDGSKYLADNNTWQSPDAAGDLEGSYKGPLDAAADYSAGDLVLAGGKVYKAKADLAAGTHATYNDLTYVGAWHATSYNNSNGNLPVTIPAGTLTRGDVLVAVSPDSSLPGWTYTGTCYSSGLTTLYMHTRIATASDEAGVTFTLEASASSMGHAGVRAYRGARLSASGGAMCGSYSSTSSYSNNPSFRGSIGESSSGARHLSIRFWSTYQSGYMAETLSGPGGNWGDVVGTGAVAHGIGMVSADQVSTSTGYDAGTITVVEQMATYINSYEFRLMPDPSLVLDMGKWEEQPFLTRTVRGDLLAQETFAKAVSIGANVTPVQMDATSVTFVAPESGAVNAYFETFNYGYSGDDQYWKVCNEDGSVTYAQMIAGASSNPGASRKGVTFPIDGLTPGQTYTFTWWATSVQMDYPEKSIMQVWSA